MKRKILAGLVTGLSLLVTVGFAEATLIETDLFTSGDGLITSDLNTGLYWLDLTVTTNLSYNDVLTQISTGGFLEGFRYATVADVDTLQVAAGLPPGLFFSASSLYTTNISALNDLVGETTSSLSITSSTGITSDPFDPTTNIADRIVRSFSITMGASSSQGVIGDSISSPDSGSWLITNTLPTFPAPVPEPTTMLLFATGLAASILCC